MKRSTPQAFTDVALKVLGKRYLLRNEKGEVIETPDEMFLRVARHVALAEKEFSPDNHEYILERFFHAMRNLEFLPNSPTLMNAGTDLGQLSACFVLPVEDSIESIFTCIKQAALIHKSGGGCGYDFSSLRPKNDIVRSTKGVASGPVSFIRAFDAATESINQGGHRRGANMGILRVDHPDIEEFIHSKRSNDGLSNFNLSVGITKRFMSALEKDADIDLVNPRTQKTTGTISASRLFQMIVESAWTSGEPGLLFLDTINTANPIPDLGDIRATNPCGEVPMLAYESCNLGSINLARMVAERNGRPFVDFKRLARTVHLAVRFLDNVIEVNIYPLEEVEKVTRANRKIGLGVMGFADMLISLGIPYDSKEALNLAHKVMSHIKKEAREASTRLAMERGPFPNFPRSIYLKNGSPQIRNATVTSIAPTGTISLVAGCSSGIEPLFSPIQRRVILEEEVVTIAHPGLPGAVERHGIPMEGLVEEIEQHGSLRCMSALPEHVSRLFTCAHDISLGWHVRMQSAFQRHVDNAVSKTVNLPHEASPDDVRRAFLLAERLGCKGITVFRDGCRGGQIVSSGSTKISSPAISRPQRSPACMECEL